MRKRLIMAAVLLLAGLAVGLTLLWQFAASQLDSGFAEWVAAAGAQGWRVTSGVPTRGGWPFAATLTVPDLSLASDRLGLPGGLAWKADQVVLRISAWHPRTLVIAAAGNQHLRLGGAPEIPLAADRFEVDILLDAGKADQDIDFAADHLRAGPGDATSLGRMRVHVAAQPAAKRGQPYLAWAAAIDDIGLPPLPEGGQWALGGRIGGLALDGVMTGPVPSLPDPTAWAKAWRDGGGTFDLSRFALQWGKLDLSGQASLSLDAHMQPHGTARLHVLRPADALDALAAGHVLPQRGATAAKAMLALMVRTPENGAPELDTTLTLEDRTVSIGSIPLLAVPELLWPSHP